MDNQQPAPTQEPATDTSTQQPAPAQEPPRRVELPLDAFNKRLADARDSGVKEALKALGVEKIEDAKALLDFAKQAKDAQKTEFEKLQDQIKALEPKAQKAEAYEKLVADMVNAQFEALPDAAKSAIDKQANGDPQERHRLMQVMREAGLLNGAPVAPPKPPAPANAAPASAPPSPAPARTAWDEYQDLKQKSSVLGSVYYETHKAEIERTRPAAGR